MRTPEHPEIACALRTGHPRPVLTVKCADCGQLFSGDHRLYISDGDTVCGECLMDRLLDAYDVDDLAHAFDIECTTAGDYLEKESDL